LPLPQGHGSFLPIFALESRIFATLALIGKKDKAWLWQVFHNPMVVWLMADLTTNSSLPTAKKAIK
jgi:hypothetical protein